MTICGRATFSQIDLIHLGKVKYCLHMTNNNSLQIFEIMIMIIITHQMEKNLIFLHLHTQIAS